jgi:hypothetical protein
MTAITELLAKVEAGEAINGYFGDAFGPTDRVNAIGAYHGSLDCAQLFIASAVPGCRWTVTDCGSSEIWAAVEPNVSSRWFGEQVKAKDGNAARTLLIAGLRELIEKQKRQEWWEAHKNDN